MHPSPWTTIEVLAYAPTAFYHCQHCEVTFREMGIGERVHREQAKESLPADLLQEFHALSDWIHTVYQRHGDRVRVKVVDAASIEGFLKSIKHRVRHYPTIVIDGKKHVRPDLQRLTHDLDEYIAGGVVDRGSRSEPREEVTHSHTS
jgi:hypothetical protein